MADVDLTPYMPHDGDAGDPVKILTALTLIQAALNDIEESQFATGKIFDFTKIKTTGAVNNDVLTYDSGTGLLKYAAGGSGGAFTVGSKISDLGAGTDGKPAKLRLSPATYLNVGGGLPLPAASVTVGDTSEFATGGTLETANGTITYTGKTATTFTGCTGGAGTLADKAVIRQLTVTAGAASYEIVPLVYDSTLGKWVSDVAIHALGIGTSAAVGAGAWTDWGLVLGSGHTVAVPWRKYDAAGLKPQSMLAGLGYWNSAVGTMQTRQAFGTMAQGAAALTANLGADANSAGGLWTADLSTRHMSNPKWADVPAFTLQDLLVLFLQVNLSAGAGSWNTGACRHALRWVG